MNLDDLDLFKQIDSQNKIREIDDLPEQLQAAWELGQAQPLPDFSGIQRIVLASAGNLAVAAELVAASVSSNIRLPLALHRDFGLPAFASGRNTLVICLGSDEETLDAFHSAIKCDCSVMALAQGGELERLAAEKNIPVWAFESKPGFVFGFGLLLALFSRLGFITDPSSQVNEAVESMKTSREHLRAEVPAANNAAKRYAGQLVGRWVTFIGTGQLAPIARRWKARVNQMAKAAANFEAIPDAGYHAAFGVVNPAEVLNSRTMTLFLRSPADDPRDRMRSDMLRQHFMLEGMNTDFVDARGESVLANVWTLILFGDYMAYYLAMAYGVDPS